MTPLSLTGLQIKARYLPALIADQLQELIVSGQFTEGERLPSERELAARVGVSRNVIREATKLLQERGLVSILPGSGVYVTEMEPSIISRSVGLYAQRQHVSIAQLYEIRWVLEVQNARLAALKASDAMIEQLEQCLNNSSAHLREPSLFTLLDVDFHLQVATASGNPILPLLLETITDALRAQCRITEQMPGAQENAYGFHRKIFEAVRAKDVDAAGQAMAAHLRSSWEWLLRAIDNPREEIGEMSFWDEW